MSDETKVPSIPALGSVLDPAARAVLAAMKETIEVRDGKRGNELDQFVKVRDLQDAGIAGFTPRTFGGGRGRVTLPDWTEGDLAVPPVITHFSVEGGYTEMALSWDSISDISYLSYSHVEIWRSATDNLGAALKIALTPANIYADPCGSDKTFYYWVRVVNKAGVTGPFNSAHGTVGSTAVDVDHMLTVLTGQITESQLYTDLGARIDLVDAPDTLVGSVSARIAALRATLGDTIATVVDRLAVVETLDETLVQRVNDIIVLSAGEASDIHLEQTARIAADEAQATQIATLSAQVGTNTAAISSETTSRATADLALTNNLNTAISRISAAEASIVSNYTTLSNVDGAQAAALNQFTARLNNIGGVSMEQKFTVQANVNTGLLAQYSLKIDSGGLVSGFGLSSETPVNGNPTSAFGIRADRFWIAKPGTDLAVAAPEASQLPFIVDNGNVYIKAAFIKDASITNAKIGTINTDKITAGLVTTMDFQSAKSVGSEFYIGGAVTYEYNDPARPLVATGIASVANPNVSLTNSGAAFNSSYFIIKNPGYTDATPFKVLGGIVYMDVAHIRDADITTLKIAGHAVSQSFAAYAGGGSATSVNAGAQTFYGGSVHITCEFWSNGLGACTYSIFRDGTPLRIMSATAAPVTTLVFVDTPGTGSHTYTATTTHNMNAISMMLLEVIR